MAGQPKSGSSVRERRQSRLADKLRQNLGKRKAKVRAARAATVSDESAELSDAPCDSGEESKS